MSLGTLTACTSKRRQLHEVVLRTHDSEHLSAIEMAAYAMQHFLLLARFIYIGAADIVPGERDDGPGLLGGTGERPGRTN